MSALYINQSVEHLVAYADVIKGWVILSKCLNTNQTVLSWFYKIPFYLVCYFWCSAHIQQPLPFVCIGRLVFVQHDKSLRVLQSPFMG